LKISVKTTRLLGLYSLLAGEGHTIRALAYALEWAAFDTSLVPQSQVPRWITSYSPTARRFQPCWVRERSWVVVLKERLMNIFIVN